MKPTLSETTSNVQPIDNEVVYHEASIDPFTSYIKIPESSNLIDSTSIMGISKDHTSYSFDVQSI